MGRAARMFSPVQAPVPARKVTGTAKPTGSDRRTPSVTPPPRHAPPPCPLLHAILTQTHVRMHSRFPCHLSLCRVTSVSVSDSMCASPVQTAGGLTGSTGSGPTYIQQIGRVGLLFSRSTGGTESASSPPWADGPPWATVPWWEVSGL